MTTACTRFVLVTALLSLGLGGCGDDDGGGTGGTGGAAPGGAGGVGGEAVVAVTPAPFGEPYDTLSEWNLFADATLQLPADRVIPYEVISPLFSDYAHKRRFIWIPEGETIGYVNDGKWSFPVGTILVKTFSYYADFRDPSQGERLMETRLLIHEPGGWDAHTYVWNDQQTEAVKQVAGATIPVTWIDTSGAARSLDYGVPNTNECQDCHGEKPELLDTMGGRTRQLDRELDYGNGPENQIDYMSSLGMFDVAPPPSSERVRLVDPFGSASLEERARSYLDSNCGHCHTEGGWASESALLLSYDLTDPGLNSDANWGVCKVPTSAGGATCGLTYDVVPGDAESSIMVCRVASDQIEVRMPPVGSKIPHDEGVELLRSWIDAMPAAVCGGT